MAVKTYVCQKPDGPPILEVPDGPYFFERLSPGTIREADYWENFRWGKDGRMLFACPRGKAKGTRCTVPLRLLRIRHDKAGLNKLVKECESGALLKRRKKTVDQIMMDIRGHGGLASSPENGSIHRAGHLLLFGYLGIVGAMMAARMFFPKLLEKGSA